MMRYYFGEIFLVLFLLKIYYVDHSAEALTIQMDTVEKRLCKSDYAFKFRVISDIKMGCFPIRTIIKQTKKKRSTSPSNLATTTVLPRTSTQFASPSGSSQATSHIYSAETTTGPTNKGASSMTLAASTTTQNSPTNSGSASTTLASNSPSSSPSSPTDRQSTFNILPVLALTTQTQTAPTSNHMSSPPSGSTNRWWSILNNPITTPFNTKTTTDSQQSPPTDTARNSNKIHVISNRAPHQPQTTGAPSMTVSASTTTQNSPTNSRSASTTLASNSPGSSPSSPTDRQSTFNILPVLALTTQTQTAPTSNHMSSPPSGSTNRWWSILNNQITTPFNTKTTTDSQQSPPTDTARNSNKIHVISNRAPHQPQTTAPSVKTTTHGKLMKILQIPAQGPAGKLRCRNALYQTVHILKKDVYKGAKYMKLMDDIIVLPGKDYYEGTLRPGMFFHGLMKLGEDYLYVGRQVPNLSVKENVLLTHPHTVEKWTATVNKTIKYFDMKTAC